MVECPIDEPGVKSIGKLTTMQGAGVSRHCTADAAAAPPESGGLVAPPAGRPGLWANGQISVQCQRVEWVIEGLDGSQCITKELQAIHVHLLVLNTPGPAIMDTLALVVSVQFRLRAGRAALARRLQDKVSSVRERARATYVVAAAPYLLQHIMQSRRVHQCRPGLMLIEVRRSITQRVAVVASKPRGTISRLHSRIPRHHLPDYCVAASAYAAQALVVENVRHADDAIPREQGRRALRETLSLRVDDLEVPLAGALLELRTQTRDRWIIAVDANPT